ncbi:hypothetical protein SFRURICE_004756 [Spodoptera frugiperda]|nr:hypothetical protein SFRURICE_004756 [Spodoptera frugiperda]
MCYFQPSRETLRAQGIAGRSPATVSAGLRSASKGSSPPEQNQTLESVSTSAKLQVCVPMNIIGRSLSYPQQRSITYL